MRKGTRRRRALPYPSLAAYLAETGTTQAELAEATGLSQGVISKYVRGLVMPRPSAALRLEKFTGVSVRELLKARAEHNGDAPDA